MSKKVVLSGYYGFKNFGDEAILSLLVTKLKSFDADISVITSNPEYTSSLYGDINTIKTFAIKSIIKSISTSDVLISGGGSLLQDTTSLKSLFYYLFIIFIALFLKKKVIIFAQGIGPINSRIGQFFTKIILKYCSYISVRDNKSAELLSKWGINSDIVPDPVFSIPIERKEKSKILGLQLRDCKTVNDEFLNNLADFVIKNFQGYEIELYSLQDSIDLEICNKFKDIISNKFDVKIFSNMAHNDVIDRINACEYLISMRFHSLIIALLAGVKTIAINYDIKVKKLADEFNLPVIELDKPFNNLELNYLTFEEISYNSMHKQFDWSRVKDIILQ